KIGYIKSVDIPLTKKNNAESKSAYTEKSLPSLEFLMEKIIFFDERIRKLELALEKVERASSKNS
ncbi:MAG: hypothetical protein QXT63_06425, partial [Thermoplasmata archaeon]